MRITVPVIGVDPGPSSSGYVQMLDGKPVAHGVMPNEEMLGWLRASTHGSPFTGWLLAIEEVTHFGMPVGRDVFQTVRWGGRFEEAWQPGPVAYVPRARVKLELCGSPRAYDGAIRQALIDRYGGDEVAIGGRKCPTCHGQGARGRGKARSPCRDCEGRGGAAKGPLYGFSGHAWAALGVAVVAMKETPA